MLCGFLFVCMLLYYTKLEKAIDRLGGAVLLAKVGIRLVLCLLVTDVLECVVWVFVCVYVVVLYQT